MLEAQIELITVPQEFTRLCNALLGAEHGSNFLPIDDDRPDRGNDGYLNSEKRMFAAHCFKRAQNQRLDHEIRSKMVGDLGKAIALKKQNLWEVEAWTFLSNYPIEEETGRIVFNMGREAQIDVSWEGPEFLSRTLQRHPEVRDRFPYLQLNTVSEQLLEIKQAIDCNQDESSQIDRITRVPRTSLERDALLALKPDGWEWLLFAATLYLGKAGLEMKWHDYEMPPHRPRHPAPEGVKPTDLLSKQIGEMAEIIQAAMHVFPPEKQEQAFGSPGESGDPVRIEHFANRIIESYENILDWAVKIREFEPPGYLVGVCEVVPKMAERPLEEFRDFINDVVRETDRVPEYVADPNPDKEPLVIELNLTLTMDDEVTAEFSNQMKRAGQLATEESAEIP